MKKVSGLIALLTCVTIGGVYANWAYAASEDIQDKFVELSLGLADAKQDGANGTYEIISNVAFKIYQKEGSDHEAELRVESTDDQAPMVTVKFTPTASASVDIKNNGVDTEIAFTTSSAFVYKMDANGNYSETGTETPVLEFANESNGTFEANVGTEADGYTFTWQKQYEEGSTTDVEYFYVTFNAEQLLEQVHLSTTKTFVLDEYKEYAAFQQSLLAAGSIILKVTDGHNVL